MNFGDLDNVTYSNAMFTQDNVRRERANLNENDFSIFRATEVDGPSFTRFQDRTSNALDQEKGPQQNDERKKGRQKERKREGEIGRQEERKKGRQEERKEGRKKERKKGRRSQPSLLTFSEHCLLYFCESSPWLCHGSKLVCIYQSKGGLPKRRSAFP